MTLPLGLALGVVALVVAAAALASFEAARRLRRTRRAAVRANELLVLAADWTWELDAQFRFTRIESAASAKAATAMGGRIGRTPWECHDFGLADSDLDAHRADLEAHRRFTGLVIRSRDSAGRVHLSSVAGAPRFDARGVFTGYIGTARDVTDELRAQRAFTASETRYRELFDRSPSPIYLHRRGVIFDANASAARLFGHDDAESMHGLRVAELFAAADRPRIEERIAELERMPVGAGLPVRDFQASMADGRPIHVQATGVRVEAAGGAATLTILFDITQRRLAEAALRRSEAMLTHLFATSPDCIALADLASGGRIAMVNAAFARLIGRPAGEIVGRTATELGIWHDEADRDRLLGSVRDDGQVRDQAIRIRTHKGTVASVVLSAARFEMTGRAYMVVTARDVTATERTRLEHAAIFERASIGIALTRDRRFVQVNPRFESIFGWPPGSLLGQPGSAVWVDAADYAEIGRVAGPLLEQGQPFESEREMRRRDGGRFWCRLLGQAVDPQQPGRGGTIWLAEDVTERHRLDAALAAARDAAEAGNRAKSAFLANTSHEIRTPLNGLLGLARLALQETVESPAQQQRLEQILVAAEGLEGILGDILDFSKIEAGTFTIETEPFELRRLLEAVRGSYRTLAEAKGLSIEVGIDAGLPAWVTGDPVRIRQILGNFVSNAVKFTDSGAVRIEAGPAAGGALRLAVVDRGPGVEPALVDKLFQPFSQGDVSKTRRYGGTGLGLSICRQLAGLMGGEVGCTTTPGQGSTFWAELPLPAAAAATPADGPRDDEAAVLAGARVLVVEDNPVNMMITLAMLEPWHVAASEARDGREAVDAVRDAAARGEPFDLVLMDVQMPVLSGHDAARELRRDFDRATLPIVALTAAALVSEREQAIASGMDEFLTKPIDAERLRRALVSHLPRRAAALRQAGR